MSSYQKALIVLVVAAVGIWGCAQGPAGGTSAEKVRTLEAKYNRLEEDFKAAASARDQFRKKLAETEQEREELQVKLRARTTERDSLTQQFDIFRKSLKDLIGQTEAALAKPATPPATVTRAVKAPNL